MRKQNEPRDISSLKELLDVLEAAKEVLIWYNTDGSVGGAVEPFEKLEKAYQKYYTIGEKNYYELRNSRK